MHQVAAQLKVDDSVIGFRLAAVRELSDTGGRLQEGLFWRVNHSLSVRLRFFFVGLDELEKFACEVCGRDACRAAHFFEPAKFSEHFVDVDTIDDDWVVTMDVVLTVVLVQDLDSWVIGSVGHHFFTPFQRP